MIEVKDVAVTFNAGTPLETHALKGITLDIKPQEFITVIGSNGAGKSTLLNVLSGEIGPSRGNVFFDGVNVTARKPFQRAHHIARVFQDPRGGTCEDLTIEENLALAFSRGKSRSLTRATSKQRVEIFKTRLAALGLGLENRLQDRIGLLSGGQRQAVSLLMAALAPMELLLLDEHTASLDPKTAGKILELTLEFIESEKLTALMVTHSMTQALELGNRILMLHEGHIVFDLGPDKKATLEVQDLIGLFESVEGEKLSDDRLLLA